jgi:hypothetical protein
MQQQAQIILIYHQGLVSMMQENSIHIFSPQLSHMVRIAVPNYPLQKPHINKAWLRVAETEAGTEVIENIDNLARDNLDTRLPAITARTMARVITKKVAASSARDNEALAGFLLDIAGLISERADTRSWTSLPASIQIARIVVPPGKHNIYISTMRTGMVPVNFELEHTINVAAGQINIITIHDIANDHIQGASHDK